MTVSVLPFQLRVMLRYAVLAAIFFGIASICCIASNCVAEDKSALETILSVAQDPASEIGDQVTCEQIPSQPFSYPEVCTSKWVCECQYGDVWYLFKANCSSAKNCCANTPKEESCSPKKIQTREQACLYSKTPSRQLAPNITLDHCGRNCRDDPQQKCYPTQSLDECRESKEKKGCYYQYIQIGCKAC